MASLVGSNGEQMELLAAVNDDYGGVIVELKAPIDPRAFAISLKSSISNWRQQGIKGVWIKLPIELASLVQIVVGEGFWYHHAEPNYLMLVYWIPATEHTIPVNATHRVGVGAFVVNDQKEILVVQEKSGKSRGLGLWKIPTGVINQGEEIFSGVIREVKEETGIDTEFVEVLAFRLMALWSICGKFGSFLCSLPGLIIADKDVHPWFVCDPILLLSILNTTMKDDDALILSTEYQHSTPFLWWPIGYFLYQLYFGFFTIIRLPLVLRWRSVF